MNTINRGFNEAWEYLAKVHPSAHLPNGESIALGEYPSIIKKDWKWYLHYLVMVLKIGERNKYLHVHVDGKGFMSVFFVPEDIATGKNKYPWIPKEPPSSGGHIEEHIT